MACKLVKKNIIKVNNYRSISENILLVYSRRRKKKQKHKNILKIHTYTPKFTLSIKTQKKIKI